MLSNGLDLEFNVRNLFKNRFSFDFYVSSTIIIIEYSIIYSNRQFVC